jgi:hypothetical protein
MNNRCIHASAFSYDKRKYFLILKGFRLKQTEAMKKGIEAHEQIATNYPKPDIAEIMKGLRAGKKIFLSEFAFCSKLYGFRGHPDLVELQYIDNNMNIKITDWKTNFFYSQMFQLAAYGLIFSDPNCEIVFESNGKRIGTRLYPRQPFNCNIECQIKLLNKPNSITRTFMENSALTQWASNYRWALLKLANNFRKLHKAGIYFITEMPYCSNCPQDSKKCSFWSRICSKSLPDLPEKERQTYFGKRKLLVKKHG